MQKCKKHFYGKREKVKGERENTKPFAKVQKALLWEKGKG
jgi:hypothetical protein